MKEFFSNDKNVVIVACVILGCLAMFRLASPENIITAIISGLFGIAVGKSLNDKGAGS